MSPILLEKQKVLKYIKETIYNLKISPTMIDNAKYHHNTSYSEASSICKYGILTINDLKKFKIKNYSADFLEKMSDIDSHINGNDNVSLAVVGLQDLYPGEDEYDPANPVQIDFLISSEIKAGRSSLHYGNEFLSYSSISTDKLRAIDIRLLRLIELIENNKISKNYSVIDVIEKFNDLRNIASTIKECQLDIPIREMSNKESFSIDIDRLSKTSKIKLKELK